MSIHPTGSRVEVLHAGCWLLGTVVALTGPPPYWPGADFTRAVAVRLDGSYADYDLLVSSPDAGCIRTAGKRTRHLGVVS